MFNKKAKYIIRNIVLYFIATTGIYSYYRRKYKQHVLIMVYHDIIKNIPQNHYNYNTAITPERFKKQIRYLVKHYNPITITQFIEWKTNNKRLPDNPVLITFDDGHSNLFNYAVPILNQYNIKGVFFNKAKGFGEIKQNTCEQFLSYSSTKKEGKELYDLFRKSNFEEQKKLLRNKNGNHQYDFPNAMKYQHMSIKECIILLKQGHSIQSHSVNHHILSSLNNNNSELEISDSKKILEKIMQTKINCFAYPFGDPFYDYGDREIEYLRRHDYSCAFQGEWPCTAGVSQEMNNYEIPRFGDINHNFQYFKLLISPFRLKRKS
ncbi:polysaccharide deacetylase family protein [Bacteroides sp.]